MLDVENPTTSHSFSPAEISRVTRALDLLGGYFEAVEIRRAAKDTDRLRAFLTLDRGAETPLDAVEAVAADQVMLPLTRLFTTGTTRLRCEDFERRYVQNFVGPALGASVLIEGSSPVAGPLKTLPVKVVDLRYLPRRFAQLHIEAEQPTLLLTGSLEDCSCTTSFLDCTFGENIEVAFESADVRSGKALDGAELFTCFIYFARPWAVKLLEPYGLQVSTRGAAAIVRHQSAVASAIAACRSFLWARYVEPVRDLKRRLTKWFKTRAQLAQWRESSASTRTSRELLFDP